MEEKKSKRLPSIRDWWVTLCEFVTVFAISSSFFTLENEEDSIYNARGNQHHTDEQETEELFMKSYLVYWGPPLAAMSVAIVVVPHVVASCFQWEWRLLRHPRFPATIQFVKVAGAASNVYYLVNHRDEYEDKTYKLKEVEKLASSGILAGCEIVIILNTILSGCCNRNCDRTTRRAGNKINPLPRLSRMWTFFNLWKDFGIVSSLVKTKELYFLLLEFPFPILLGSIMSDNDISSQSAWYHFLRLLMVGWGGVTLFVSSKMHDDGFEFVHELIVPCSLVACEVVLALCEITNGRDNRKLKNDERRTTRLTIPMLEKSSSAESA